MRRRSSWEAADSGLLFWRDSFFYFIPFFAIPVWLFAFGLRLLPDFLRLWSYSILWWFKPFFDRLVLHVVSVRFFEPQPGVLRLFRGLGTSLWSGLAGDLLWRRFSPWRASRMPIRVLERLKLRQVRQRKKVLERGGLDFCLLITILGAILEIAILWGEILFFVVMFALFRPGSVPSLLDRWMDFEIYIYAGECFNFILIESLYVCMGFGLYINSRVEVEGWDIQLLFHQFTESKRPGISGREPALSGGLVLLLCLFLTFFSPPGVYADTSGPSDESIYLGEPLEESLEEEDPVKVLYSDSSSYRPPLDIPEVSALALETLDEILSSPDFGGEREGWGIRFKDSDESSSAASELTFFPWNDAAKIWIGSALRFLLAAGLAVLAFFAFCRLYKLRRLRKSPAQAPWASRGKASPPAQDSPESLFLRAEAFYRQGKLKEAWASCFAGTIAVYTCRGGLFFPPEATEYDCLTLVRSAGTSGPRAGVSVSAGEFAELVRNWVYFVYAGQLPGEGAFERSLNFGKTLLRTGVEQEAASCGASVAVTGEKEAPGE
jgi:hypothetical protein